MYLGIRRTINLYIKSNQKKKERKGRDPFSPSGDMGLTSCLHVREFALPVGRDPVVFPLLEIQVVEVERSRPMRCRRDGDNARLERRRRAAQERRLEELKQEEVREVVCGPVHFEPIRRSALGYESYARVRDQDVEGLAPREEFLRAGPHAGEGLEVEFQEVHLVAVVEDIPERRLGLLEVARCEE